MGLGKSLQIVALVFTLLRDGPSLWARAGSASFASSSSSYSSFAASSSSGSSGASGMPPPLLHKAVVVCPSTLVSNWKKEFDKWVGSLRLPTLAVQVWVWLDGKRRHAHAQTKTSKHKQANKRF